MTIRWKTLESYQRHREYNKRVRRDKQAEKRRIRLVAEGKCIRCEVIKSLDGGDKHAC